MHNLISAGFFRLKKSRAFAAFCVFSALCGALSAISS